MVAFVAIWHHGINVWCSDNIGNSDVAAKQHFSGGEESR
jgi:hypothetical protein